MRKLTAFPRLTPQHFVTALLIVGCKGPSSDSPADGGAQASASSGGAGGSAAGANGSGDGGVGGVIETTAGGAGADSPVGGHAQGGVDGGGSTAGGNVAANGGAGGTGGGGAANPSPVALALGTMHSCALDSAGAVKCWGDNDYGELGIGSQDPYKASPEVAYASGVVSIASGDHHVCVMTAAGGVECWGENNAGQLGNGVFGSNQIMTSPIAVPGLSSGVTSLALGGMHSCALLSTGGVTCWGANYSGQVGNGTPSEAVTSPTPVAGLETGVQAIAAGNQHTCVLMQTGAVKCWGGNDYGQLGLGNAGSGTAQTSPQAVPTVGTDATTLSAAGNQTCVTTSSASLLCWGENTSGQMGTGATPPMYHATPIQPSGMSAGVVSVTVGGYHVCAVMNGGVAKCWGYNEVGQVGDSTSANAYTPATVQGLSGSVVALGLGYAHTCAIMAAGGGIECWGLDNVGQLGTGSPTNMSLAPVPVIGF